MAEEQVLCKSCQAKIKFIKLNSKKPDGKNRYAIVDLKPLKVWVYVGGNWTTAEAFQDHHASCPNAEQFRQPEQQQQQPEQDGFDLPF